MKKAAASNPDAAWKVVVFHSDIYGLDSHMQIQMLLQNRIISAIRSWTSLISTCVLLGHDHTTYSRSYSVYRTEMLSTHDLSKGSANNPRELFITNRLRL